MSTTSQAVPQLDMDPYSDDVLADPTEFYRRLREIGPAARVEQAQGFDLVAVGRYDDVKTVYSDHDRFLNSHGSGVVDITENEWFREPGVLLETDPPRHDGPRAVMAEIISPRSVRRLRTEFQAAADKIVDRLLELGTFDVQTEFAEAFPLQVIPDAVMGAPKEGRENLLRYSTVVFELMGPVTPRAQGVIDRLGDTGPILEWITEGCARENVAAGSFGATIWAAADAGRITDGQAANMVRSLLSAGVDTTIHSLAIAVHHLATHPGEWAKLREAPQRAKFAYEESLRCDSVVRQNLRTAAADTDIGGVPVRKGQKIMVCPGAANRDPRKWGLDADRFDIDRSEGGHLGFGRGVHQCVGAPIARLEADVLLSTLATRVDSLEPAGEPEPLLNNTLRGFTHLPIRVTPA
jgi:cytochrome P450